MTNQAILSTLLIAFAISETSFSQEKKEETKIIIKSNVNGKTTSKEMSFDKKLSQDEIQQIMSENQHDTLKTGSKKITVIIGNEEKIEELRKNRNFDEFDENLDYPENKSRNRNRINRNEIERKGKIILDEIPHRVQRADDFIYEIFNDQNDEELTSIRNIEVFANNPRSEFINIKFRCTKKDLISLSLIDLNGKKVAEETIKDFSGNYFGQMKVDKNLKGTFFLLLTQNQDGEVQKVFLK